MRSISSALANHLAGDLLTVATLWKIVRTDGHIFGFTEHDQDLTLDGLTYASTGGHTSSAIVWSDDLSTSNQEVTAVFDSSAINAQDVAVGAVALAGLFVLARRMHHAMRPAGTSDSAACPNCGGDEHCAPKPPTPASH